jgi:hypothetical protein
VASIDIELEECELTEDERVVQWRLEGLESAGYDEVTALELALAPYVDLHRALELARNGCPHDLAFRILL